MFDKWFLKIVHGGNRYLSLSRAGIQSGADIFYSIDTIKSI